MPALIWAFLAFLAAGVGSAAAYRLRRELPYIMSFSAGLILTTALLDLVPEALELGERGNVPTHQITGSVVIGFLAFFVLNRALGFRAHGEEHHRPETTPWVGVLGAGAFTLHSFFDGTAIGVAFQVNRETGILIGIAVVAHRFSDGLNTTMILLAHGNPVKRTLTMIMVAALAPILGAGLALMGNVSPSFLARALPLYAGVFIYIATSDLLPEVYRSERSPYTMALTLALTLAGAGLIFALIATLG